MLSEYRKLREEMQNTKDCCGQRETHSSSYRCAHGELQCGAGGKTIKYEALEVGSPNNCSQMGHPRPAENVIKNRRICRRLIRRDLVGANDKFRSKFVRQ